MSRIFVVVDHLEVEPNNWSSEVIKAFHSFDMAHNFAKGYRYRGFVPVGLATAVS